MFEKNVRKLYSLYFYCEWLLDAGDKNLLSLGKEFDERIVDLLAFRQLVEKEISLLSEEELARLVGNSTEEVSEDDQATTIRHDKKFRNLARAAPAEVIMSSKQAFTLWALGLRPEVFADFDYWEKFEAFTLGELAWLSTGLTPQTATAEKELQKMARTHVFPLAELERRRKLILRAFPKARRGHITAQEFHIWSSQVRLEWYGPFHEMIQNAANLSDQDQVETHLTTSERPPDKREIDKIAQLFTVMAIDHLGYDPNAKRSPVPKEISDLAAEIGVDVSDDTVRKYLKLGSRFIPDDWKPSIR